MAMLKKYRIALLAALLVSTISAGAMAFHRHYFFFWRKLPTPIADGTEFLLELDRGLLYQLCNDGTNPTVRTRIELDDDISGATVTGGQLVFEQIFLEGDDGGTEMREVTIDLLPANLHSSFFGSFFSTTGTAEIDDLVNTPTTIDVSLSGYITSRYGDPKLRATLRAFDVDTANPPKTLVTLLRVNVNGVVDIPPP